MVPDWFRATALSCVRPPFEYFRPDIALRFPKSQHQQFFRLQAFCFTEEQGKFLVPLKHSPDTEQRWQLQIAVGNFLDNPTKQNLALQLRFLAKVPKIDAGGNSWRIPWTLAACLRGHRSMKLDELADAIERGDLGDFEDWKAAERRWLSKGVTLEECQDNVGRLPFTKEISEVGFPYNAYRRMLVSHYWGIDPRLIFPFIDELRGSSIGADLAERYLALLSSESEFTDKTGVDFSPLRQLLAILRPGGVLDVSALAAIFPTSISDDWLVQIDKLANEASWLSAPRRKLDLLAHELWKAFMADAGRKGLLKVLAQLSTTTAIPEIPFEYLDPSKTTERNLQSAEIILLLTQQAAHSRGAELAQHAAALGDGLDTLLTKADNVFKARAHNVTLANAFLLSLLEKIPVSNSDLRGHTLAVINNQVGRRRSGLDEPSVWNELKLFAC